MELRPSSSRIERWGTLPWGLYLITKPSRVRAFRHAWDEFIRVLINVPSHASSRITCCIETAPHYWQERACHLFTRLAGTDWCLMEGWRVLYSIGRGWGRRLARGIDCGAEWERFFIWVWRTRIFKRKDTHLIKKFRKPEAILDSSITAKPNNVSEKLRVGSSS